MEDDNKKTSNTSPPEEKNRENRLLIIIIFILAILLLLLGWQYWKQKQAMDAKMTHASLGSDLRGSRRSLEKDTLTRRESEVIKLLAEGKSTKDVAVILGLERKDSGDTSQQPHGQTWTALGQRTCSICGAEQYCADGGGTRPWNR